MKPSHHLLRRRARAKKQHLDRLVEAARFSDDPVQKTGARAKLRKLGVESVEPKPVFMVERTQRGPWLWRVVQVG